MNWKTGLTRVYYVLWTAWAICWIYWSALNLVHFGPWIPAAAGSLVLQSSGEARWYFHPRPSTGQLLMLSMVGAALPGALLLAGRWIADGFSKREG